MQSLLVVCIPTSTTPFHAKLGLCQKAEKGNEEEKEKKGARGGVKRRKKGRKTLRTVGSQGCGRWTDAVKTAKHTPCPIPAALALQAPAGALCCLCSQPWLSFSGCAFVSHCSSPLEECDSSAFSSRMHFLYNNMYFYMS